MTIDVYTSNSCAYCNMVKQYLSFKGKQYNEINIEQFPEKRQEMFKLSGSMSVPVTIVRSNEKQGVVTGYNLSALSPLIN